MVHRGHCTHRTSCFWPFRRRRDCIQDARDDYVFKRISFRCTILNQYIMMLLLLRIVVVVVVFVAAVVRRPLR